MILIPNPSSTETKALQRLARLCNPIMKPTKRKDGTCGTMIINASAQAVKRAMSGQFTFFNTSGMRAACSCHRHCISNFTCFTASSGGCVKVARLAPGLRFLRHDSYTCITRGVTHGYFWPDILISRRENPQISASRIVNQSCFDHSSLYRSRNGEQHRLIKLTIFSKTRSFSAIADLIEKVTVTKLRMSWWILFLRSELT